MKLSFKLDLQSQAGRLRLIIQRRLLGRV